MLLDRIMFTDEAFYLQQMFCAFFNLTTAKFAFYKGVAAIGKMQHEVGF